MRFTAASGRRERAAGVSQVDVVERGPRDGHRGDRDRRLLQRGEHRRHRGGAVVDAGADRPAGHRDLPRAGQPLDGRACRPRPARPATGRSPPRRRAARSSAPPGCPARRAGPGRRSPAGPRDGRPPRGSAWSAGSSAAPDVASRAISAHISARACGSRPVVGSSRNSTAGRCTSPIATSSLRCMPPEYCLTIRFAASVSENSSSSSSTRCFAARPRIPWMCAASSRFSRPVAWRSVPDPCVTTPIARRTSFGCASTSMPATVAAPLVGRDSVVRILMVVDLPAPFGPSRPNTVPGRTREAQPVERGDLPVLLHEVDRLDCRRVVVRTRGRAGGRGSPGWHGHDRVPPWIVSEPGRSARQLSLKVRLGACRTGRAWVSDRWPGVAAPGQRCVRTSSRT